MTFKEEIELQLKDNKILSYEILSNLKNKTYFSGREKQVGDTILFGMLKESKTEEGELSLRLVTFHNDELEVLYTECEEYYTTNKENKLPIIKRIENGN